MTLFKNMYHINYPEQKLGIQEKLSLFMQQSGVSEILEWTFMYDAQSVADARPYNKTFFDTVGGVPYSQWKTGEIKHHDLISRVNNTFNTWVNSLEEIKSELSTGDSADKKSIIEIEGIDYIITGIRTAQSATSIELEKTTSVPFLTASERKMYNSAVEEGQTKLYGPKISDSKEESVASLELLQREFFEHGNRLNREESDKFTVIYGKLAQKVQEKWAGTTLEIPSALSTPKALPRAHLLTSETIEKIKETKLPKVVYMELWQKYIDALGLHQKVIINPNASSIYDGPSFLEVPDRPTHDSLSLNTVLSLMIHEVGAHYVNQAISERNGFQIRGAKNIEKEEGLAVVLEDLFAGHKLVDIKGAGYSFPYILAGELLTQSERRDLVDLRLKLDGENGDQGHKRDLRIMRGYSLEGPGAQRKDCSYGRGKNKIADLLGSGQCKITDLYSGKFSIEDTISGKLDGLISNESKIFPLLFPEMILFLVATGRAEFTHERFMDYMREKYAGDITEEEMNSIEVVKSFSKLKLFVTMQRQIDEVLKG